MKDATWSIALALVVVGTAPAAGATNNLFGQIPNQPDSCNTCHTNGPGSPRNAFGLQVEMNTTGDANTGTLDWATLCGLDADGDGSTNGAELGDPCCVFMDGAPPSTTTADPSDGTVLSSLRCEDGMVVVDELPPGWICPSTWFGADDGCDCGCGALDDDCADASVNTCESNGCPDADVGERPDPADATQCISGNNTGADGGTTGGDAPEAWTCNPGWFGNGDGCDCGCGAVDDDCTDDTLESCESNGCPAAASGEVPDPEAPTTCITPSEGGLFGCEQTRGSTAAGLMGMLVLLATRGRGRSFRRRRARG